MGISPTTHAQLAKRVALSCPYIHGRHFHQHKEEMILTISKILLKLSLQHPNYTSCSSRQSSRTDLRWWGTTVRVQKAHALWSFKTQPKRYHFKQAGQTRHI